MNWPTFNSNQSAVIELALNTTVMQVANATALDALCFTELGKSSESGL